MAPEPPDFRVTLRRDGLVRLVDWSLVDDRWAPQHAPRHLAKRLVDVLARRPGLDFSKAEVNGWVELYRGRAMHADRRGPRLEADVRSIIDRVLFATYDVLFSKLTWGTPDAGRRDVWTLQLGR
jgi:hypothetical protein